MTSVAIRFRFLSSSCLGLNAVREADCSRSLESKACVEDRFAPLPACPGSSRARARHPRTLGGRGHVLQAARPEPRRPDVQLHGRADHGEQPDGRAPRLGPHAQGRLPALQGAPRLTTSATRTASTARASGSRSRSRRRSASTRSARSRSTGSPSSPSAARSASRTSPAMHHRAVEAPRHVDGLGQRLLHVQRHEHRVHLALPQGGARPRLAVQGPPLDAVVPALRHVALEARAGRRGELHRARAPVALRALPADGARGRVARRLDDDAVDAAGERRRRREARTPSTAAARTATGSRSTSSRTTRSSSAGAARSSSASSYEGPSTTCRRSRASSTA